MYLQKNSLKIVEVDYVIDFKFFAVLGYDTLPTEFNEPFFVSGDYWNIHFCYLYTNQFNYGWVMELTHSDITKIFKGTWSITLLGLESRNNVTVSNKSLDEKIDIPYRDSSLYSIAFNSIATFEVKIVLFPSIQDDLKEENVGGVLSDLHQNYEDIASTSDIMITAGYDNSENIPVHKAILTLRSPVFKAMFDNNMTESSSNQIQIPDFDSITIKRMVEFLYKDTFTDIDDTSYEDFISLLAIANKYEINSLKEASVYYLNKKITLDNVADMRNKAILYDSDILLNYCLQFIESHYTVLFKNDSFLSKCNASQV